MAQTMPVLPVSSASDPRVSAYTSIRERDLTSGHGGRFIVEGKVTLETLLTRSRFQIESLFLCDTRLEPLDGLLSRVPAEVPVYVAAQDVMDAVAGFPMHRGVLACGLKAPPSPASDLLLPTGHSTALLLAGLSNHDNVGACFRNAAAFGARAVLLDETSCDPLYRKAIRVSSGTTLWMPFAHGGTGASLIEAAEATGHEVWAMTPDPAAQTLGTLQVPPRVALLLGAEGPGLPRELIARARPVRIPMTDGFDSINVATAGAIALAHIYNRRLA